MLVMSALLMRPSVLFAKKKGNFERACKLKQAAKDMVMSQGTVNIDSETDTDNYEQAYDVGVVDCSKVAREVLSTVTFHLQNPVSLVGKVDTGAMVTYVCLFPNSKS